jgi:hypothetical protein
MFIGQRCLTREAWAFAMGVFDGLPDSASAARMRFVLAFMYSTGLRRAELCGAFTDDISLRYAGADRARCPAAKARRSASFHACHLCSQCSATIWSHAAFRVIPSPARPAHH